MLIYLWVVMESEKSEVEHRGREGSEAIWLDRGHVAGLMIGDPVSIKPPKTVKFSEDYITLTKDRKEIKGTPRVRRISK